MLILYKYMFFLKENIKFWLFPANMKLYKLYKLYTILMGYLNECIIPRKHWKHKIKIIMLSHLLIKSCQVGRQDISEIKQQGLYCYLNTYSLNIFIIQSQNSKVTIILYRTLHRSSIA